MEYLAPAKPPIRTETALDPRFGHEARDRPATRKIAVVLLFCLCPLVSMAQVRIADPANGAYLSGEYEVLLETGRADQVAETQLMVDGEVRASRSGWAAAITIDFGESIGRHELRAVVVLADGSREMSPPVFTRELTIDLSETSRVILVTALVRTRRNKPVIGLDRDQFRVYEDGNRLEIQTFDREQLLLDLVFAVDTSSSLRETIGEVKAAAITFVQALDSADRVALFEIKNQPQRLLGFTNDRKRLIKVIEERFPRGETALFDSMLASLDALEGRNRGRRALVLFTDGRDSVYPAPTTKANLLRKVISRAQNLEVAIYTIGLGKRINEKALFRIAEETGGRFHFADKPKRLREIFEDIVTDLKHQYVLGVVPQAKKSGFHRIEVKVKERGAEVTARKGYTLR